MLKVPHVFGRPQFISPSFQVWPGVLQSLSSFGSGPCADHNSHHVALPCVAPAAISQGVTSGHVLPSHVMQLSVSVTIWITEPEICVLGGAKMVNFTIDRAPPQLSVLLQATGATSR
jgi:hypothetical protein